MTIRRPPLRLDAKQTTPSYATAAQGALADSAVQPERTISTGTGLTGGGDLSDDRTLAVVYGTTAGTACEGNDARLSDARTPTAHTHVIADTTGLQTALDGKAAASHVHAVGDVTPVTATRLVGRGAGSGNGALQEITLGAGLAFDGTTLNATGGGGGTDREWSAVGDGATTGFAIAGRTSTKASSYLVTVGGLLQPPSSYTIGTSAEDITFDEPPPYGAGIIITAPFYAATS